MCPTVSLIWPDGLFRQWILTHDDEDGISHMSVILWQLPASANAASNNSGLVTFSPAEGDFMRYVPSLHPIPSQTGVNTLAVKVSQFVPGFTSSSWTSRNCSIGNATSTRSSERSARNGSTCFASSTRIISRCHSSI